MQQRADSVEGLLRDVGEATRIDTSPGADNPSAILADPSRTPARRGARSLSY